MRSTQLNDSILHLHKPFHYSGCKFVFLRWLSRLLNSGTFSYNSIPLEIFLCFAASSDNNPKIEAVRTKCYVVLYSDISKHSLIRKHRTWQTARSILFWQFATSDTKLARCYVVDVCVSSMRPFSIGSAAEDLVWETRNQLCEIRRIIILLTFKEKYYAAILFIIDRTCFLCQI